MWLRILVGTNGAYDILCALLALFFPDVFLGTLHVNMFVSEKDNRHVVLRRVMAYWILSYGTIRLTWGIVDTTPRGLVALSYFLEAVCMWMEDVVYLTTHEWKVAIVAWSCVVMGALVLIY